MHNTPHVPSDRPLPNATNTLVLGILSIVGCFCFGIAGLVCGIIALVLAGKDTRLFERNPYYYSISSYKNLNAGKICAIIGVVVSSIYMVLMLLMKLLHWKMPW